VSVLFGGDSIDCFGMLMPPFVVVGPYQSLRYSGIDNQLVSENGERGS
jgi:hypothetical protein